MTKAISHRGPDGEGFFRRDLVAFGHRRLAIIDLESGQQPMSNRDETLWIIYNGELYNYLDLREQLQQKGYCFATQSDTEVILHAYAEWGAECLQRFRGMFAFAVADFRERKLFLARDHFGIKPLFYRIGDGYLAFASELAALRQVDDDAAPTGSLQAVDLYLRFQYIPTPHTIYKEVFKLPPASFMQVHFDGRSEQPVKYWDLNFDPEQGISDEEWEQRAEALIRDSVAAHLVADVPYGVFLSGGVDSSLVALEMSRLLDHPVQAFSIGFAEKEYSELDHAEEAARKGNIELHTEVLRDKVLDMLPDLVAHYGEPFGDSSAIPTWYVSRLARRRVPMVLSGDGGDEMFGGYNSYLHWMTHDTWPQIYRRLRSSPRATLRGVADTAYQRLRSGSWNNLTEWQKRIVYVGEQARSALWQPDYRHTVAQSCGLFEEASEKAQSWDRLAYAQYLDFKTYLPCDILTKVDVASMYHGLEVRTPLIDVRVAEFAARLPLEQRFRLNGNGSFVGKYLLKRILGKDFSSEFVHRKKQGFSLPRALWFFPGQPGRKLLESVLQDSQSRLHQWFNPDRIQSHLNAHGSQWDMSAVLWLLLVLGIWLEQNPRVEFN